jgi:hypothetical protein
MNSDQIKKFPLMTLLEHIDTDYRQVVEAELRYRYMVTRGRKAGSIDVAIEELKEHGASKYLEAVLDSNQGLPDDVLDTFHLELLQDLYDFKPAYYDAFPDDANDDDEDVVRDWVYENVITPNYTEALVHKAIKDLYKKGRLIDIEPENLDEHLEMIAASLLNYINPETKFDEAVENRLRQQSQ